MLLLVHTTLAAATKTPEMVLDKTESDLLANATVELGKQYDVQLDPKMQAAVALIGAAGLVYGPRVIAIKVRKAGERKAKAAQLSMPLDDPKDVFQ